LERLSPPRQLTGFDPGSNLLGHTLCGLAVAAAQRHREFVATEARDGIVAAHAVGQDRGDHLVARCVAAGVVDSLEAIQVDEKSRREGSAVAKRPRPAKCIEVVSRLAGFNFPRSLSTQSRCCCAARGAGSSRNGLAAAPDQTTFNDQLLGDPLGEPREAAARS